MLQESNFWGEALSTFCHTRNLAPTSAVTGSATPYKLFYGKKPNVSHLRVFGSLAYVHIQKDKISLNLGSHMKKCIFLGYPLVYKGWRFYNPVTKKFIICERADFDERFYPGLKKLDSLLSSLGLIH